MEVGFSKILFCTDFSKGAAKAFPYALKSAGNNRAKLYLLHVIPEADAQFWKGYVVEDGQDLDEKTRNALDTRIREEYLSQIPDGINYEVVYRAGSASQQILDFSHENDVSLVVLGRPRRRFLRSMLYGSVASKVARLIECPLLVVPA